MEGDACPQREAEHVRALELELVENTNDVKRQKRRLVLLGRIELRAPTVTAEVDADHAVTGSRQQPHPAPLRPVLLDGAREAVQEGDRQPFAPHLVPDAAVFDLQGGHAARADLLLRSRESRHDATRHSLSLTGAFARRRSRSF